MFKIDGPILKKGIPIPVAVAALQNFQSILDKTYLVLSDKEKMTVYERDKFFLRATEFKHGSFETYFDIAIQGVQLSLPFISSAGPQNIWELTKQSFEFLKLACKSVQEGKELKYEFNNEGDANVHIGNNTHNYNSTVIQIAQLSLASHQDLAHLISENKINNIQAGAVKSNLPDIFLGENDRAAFDLPTRIQKKPIKLNCEIFNFNKFKNTGKLSVTLGNQDVPTGEYSFEIFEKQDNTDYIYSLLKPQIIAYCLVEEVINPFEGKKINKLYITGID